MSLPTGDGAVWDGGQKTWVPFRGCCKCVPLGRGCEMWLSPQHNEKRTVLRTHTQLLCVLDSGQWSLNSCYLGVQQSCVPCLAHPLPPSSVYWITGVSQTSLCPLQPPLLSSPLPMRRALPHIHIPRRMRDAKCLGSAAVFKPHPAT